MSKTKISAPWYTFVRELTAMFVKDNDITIKYDEENQIVNIDVSKYKKAVALSKILPKTKSWGNVELKICINYKSNLDTMEDIVKHAFENNPAFKYVYSFKTDTNPITYVICEKEVVQYWNDDLHDPHGVTSTLYENIARNIFDDKNGLVFSTDSDAINRVPYNPTNKMHQPTNEEVALWEKYNGKGSYSNGSSPKSNENEETIHVKDEKTFKSIFNYKENKKKAFTVEEEEDLPF